MHLKVIWGRTDGPTDGRTNIVSYRGASSHLKMIMPRHGQKLDTGKQSLLVTIVLLFMQEEKLEQIRIYFSGTWKEDKAHHLSECLEILLPFYEKKTTTAVVRKFIKRQMTSVVESINAVLWNIITKSHYR
jgi:hypothetical protein